MSNRAIDVIIIDDSSDEDDDELDSDLALAIKLSKEESKNNNVNKNKNNNGNGISSTSTIPSKKRDSSALSPSGSVSRGNEIIDKKVKTTTTSIQPSRAEMERERLIRLQALELAGTTIKSNIIKSKPTQNTLKLTTISDIDSSNSNSTSNESASGSKNSYGYNSNSTASTSGSSNATVNYWKPTIKRVPNNRTPNDDGMSLAQIVGPKNGKLGKDHPRSAIVSSYCIDMLWVGDHFSEATSLLIVKHRDPSNKEPAISQIGTQAKMQNLFLLYPETKTGGIMHVKSCILYYDTYMRVVIPTANFLDFDWHTIDNAFFIQDFPLISSIDPSIIDPRLNPTHTPQFSFCLLNFLTQLGVPALFLKPFLSYNFSSSDTIRLIGSTPGIWKVKDGNFERGGGIVGLSNTIKSLKFEQNGSWEIEATTSSVGGLTNSWLGQFLAAAQGINPKKYLTKTVATPPSIPCATDNEIWTTAPFKILFPTLTQIDASYNGRPGGGTLFCANKTWTGSNFPQHLFYKCESKNRPKIVSHTKIIAALKKITKNDDEATFKHEGWVYVGSHNFTSAAWGKLSTPAGQPSLSINNYELGVIIKISATSDRDLESKVSNLVTYQRPLTVYNRNDVPWMQFLHLNSR